MSFYPAEFDPRGDVVAMLDLCAIDTPDGVFRFLIGVDGVFTDIDGNTWVGSALAQVSELGSAIGGEAPGGSVSLSYFQDPDTPDLIGQIRTLGLTYVDGRAIRFYVQPIRTMAEFQAPTIAPILRLTRVMREVTTEETGALDRTLILGFEAWSERRDAARRIQLTTEGHKVLLGGVDNPSLSAKPTVDFQEEKLFG